MAEIGERHLSHRRQDAFGKSGRTSREFTYSKSVGEPQDAPQKSCPSCPECGSQRVTCDGHRYLKDGTDIQRFKCKECGHRFSVGHVRNNAFKEQQGRRQRQICVLAKAKAKNLTTTTEIKTVVGEVGAGQQEVKGRIVQYAIALKNKGRTTETVRTYIGDFIR
jgi:DNA-directed RNA polymerase subunit M/transcription elongation factor TFIIS